MKNKILIVSFNYEPWPLAAAIEIITNEIKSGSEVTWIDLNNSFDKILLFPFSDTIKNFKIKNRIKKKFLNDNKYKNYSFKLLKILVNLMALELLLIINFILLILLICI